MELRDKTNVVTKNILSKTNFKIWIILLLLMILFGTTLFFYFRYSKLKKEVNILKDPQAQVEINKQESHRLVAEISKVMSLPTDEEPVFGTIKDTESLSKTQKFFVGSQNGDKILIYKDKAIIYREEEKKIINVGPVFISPDTVETSTTASSTDSMVEVDISVEVRNGSGVTGAASSMGEEISLLSGYTLDGVGDADAIYEETIVINFTGKDMSTLLEKIPDAKVLDGLPEGERISESDVLVIIGK